MVAPASFSLRLIGGLLLLQGLAAPALGLTMLGMRTERTPRSTILFL
jgi:hypothetical protein